MTPVGGSLHQSRLWTRTRQVETSLHRESEATQIEQIDSSRRPSDRLLQLLAGTVPIDESVENTEDVPGLVYLAWLPATPPRKLRFREHFCIDERACRT